MAKESKTTHILEDQEDKPQKGRPQRENKDERGKTQQTHRKNDERKQMKV